LTTDVVTPARQRATTATAGHPKPHHPQRIGQPERDPRSAAHPRRRPRTQTAPAPKSGPTRDQPPPPAATAPTEPAVPKAEQTSGRTEEPQGKVEEPHGSEAPAPVQEAKPIETPKGAEAPNHEGAIEEVLKKTKELIELI
jgi:hypothetical protein